MYFIKSLTLKVKKQTKQNYYWFSYYQVLKFFKQSNLQKYQRSLVQKVIFISIIF